MKEYSCGDIVPGCGAQFRVNSEEEMLEICTMHAQRNHDLPEIVPEDLIARLHAAIRTTD